MAFREFRTYGLTVVDVASVAVVMGVVVVAAVGHVQAEVVGGRSALLASACIGQARDRHKTRGTLSPQAYICRPQGHPPLSTTYGLSRGIDNFNFQNKQCNRQLDINES